MGWGNSHVLSKVFFVFVAAGIIEPAGNQLQHQLDLDAAACLLLIAFTYVLYKKMIICSREMSYLSKMGRKECFLADCITYIWLCVDFAVFLRQ